VHGSRPITARATCSDQMKTVRGRRRQRRGGAWSVFLLARAEWAGWASLLPHLFFQLLLFFSLSRGILLGAKKERQREFRTRFQNRLQTF
jgi:hypothetical protein